MRDFRYATVQRALHKDSQTTFVIEESSVDGPMFGLVMSDLYQIKPNYDAMVKGGTLRLSEDGLAQGTSTYIISNFSLMNLHSTQSLTLFTEINFKHKVIMLFI